MPTILSRFDMIFIVKDEHEQSKDMVSYFVMIRGQLYVKEIMNNYVLLVFRWRYG